MLLPGNYQFSLEQGRTVIHGYRKSTVQLFDGSNAGPHDAIVAADITSLAVINGLGGAEPSAVVGNLWDARTEIEPLIPPIPKAPLESLSAADREHAVESVTALLERIQQVPLWGGHGVAASKLAHRLRPNVAPIWDAFAGDAWYTNRISWPDWLRQTYDQVLSPANLGELQQLQREARGWFGCDVPLLRVWDMILWWEGQPD